MAGFFNNLMNAVNKIEKMANDIKDVQNTINNMGVNNNNNNASNKNQPNDLNVSNMQADYIKNLTDNYYKFEFDGTYYRYKECNPTNFDKVNDNFGAAEICNVYLYSKGGEEIEDLDSVNLSTTTLISFGNWEYEPEKGMGRLNMKLKSYGISNPKIENINENNVIYKVVGESNNTYYESYLLKPLGRYEGDIDTHENYFQVTLRINKKELSVTEIQNVLNEFASIVNTLETSCDKW